MRNNITNYLNFSESSIILLKKETHTFKQNALALKPLDHLATYIYLSEYLF
jgi:hypothetical protein